MALDLRTTIPCSIFLVSLSLAACQSTEPAADDAAGSTSSDATTTSGVGTTTEAADESGDGSSSGTGADDSLPFDPAGPDAAPDPARMGPYPVGVMTVELLDDSRPDDDGQPRRLVTELWYPAVEAARDQPGYVYTEEDLLTEEARAQIEGKLEVELATEAVRDADPRDTGEQFPIVLFSHGSSGVRMQSTFLTVFLASHGYVVAAPDHAGNTLSDAVLAGEQSTEAQFESLGLRPDDMGFVLAHLQGLGAEDPLGAIVDGERVGMSGHSFGALTTLRMLGQDRPIDVAVAQAPPGYEVTWFGALANEPEDITIPVMLQVGEVDATTTPEDADTIYSRMTAPRSRLTVREGGHFTFSDMCVLDPAAIEAATEIGLSAALDDGCTEEHIAPELALPLQRHFAIGLFNGHLRDSPGSLELLTTEAAEAVAPGMFVLEYEP
ncbi:MAG: hypothetical protein AAF799_17825 [Myxococcota bacterium]